MRIRSFWTNALGSDPGNLSDPRILYLYPASQRWFAVMITTDQTTNNKILFARSEYVRSDSRIHGCVVYDEHG